MQNNQKILVIKDCGDARVGDLAVECGWDGKKHQFHSTYLQPTYGRDENYWVEFLGEDCFITVKDTECERRVEEARKELIAELVRWMRMENSVAVVHREQWNEFIKSLTQPKGT